MNSLMSLLKSILAVTLCLSTIIIFVSPGCSNQTHLSKEAPKLNDLNYFETRGFNMLVFSNWYDVNFFDDSKLSGIEIIHHDVRTATNGDVRLNPTPEQWDPIPEFVERKVDKQNNTIEAFLTYPDYNFDYTIKAEAQNGSIRISVNLTKPLPQALADRAGFNLEFLPSAYFEKTYLMDNNSSVFPLYPTGPMLVDTSGTTEPKPIAAGKQLVLAPEDPARRVTIKAEEGELLLFDGRNKAQNGWFVVRTLIPENKEDWPFLWAENEYTIGNAANDLLKENKL